MPDRVAPAGRRFERLFDRDGLIVEALPGAGPALFVRDETRSWGRHPLLAEALALAFRRMRQPGARVLALGASMGGHAALRAAGMVPVDVVLAFGPQSQLEAAGPRWQPWAARAAPLTVPPLAAGWTVICHGLEDDAGQAAGFAPAPGLDHILFPGQTHSGLVPHLKARGVLAGLAEAALAGDRRRLLRIAASAGGRLRRDQLPR